MTKTGEPGASWLNVEGTAVELRSVTHNIYLLDNLTQRSSRNNDDNVIQIKCYNFQHPSYFKNVTNEMEKLNMKSASAIERITEKE